MRRLSTARGTRPTRQELARCGRRGDSAAIGSVAVAWMQAIVAEAVRTPRPGDRAAWADVMAPVELRRRLSMTETSRGKIARGAISPAPLAALIAPVVAIGRECVADRAAAAGISERVHALLIRDEPDSWRPRVG
jgi:hypothetical protein